MAKTKITAPVAAPGEVIGVGGLVFTDGVAETDDPAVLAYAERHGYGVGRKKPAGVTDMDDSTAVPNVDSREIHKDGPVQLDTLRDAAVDPRPDDYLAPVNAGKADPHGPLVVAPEIHGSGRGPQVPGAVHEDKEADAAKRALVDGKPVPELTASLAGDNTGPLDLSDPSSGEFADTGVADSEGAVTPKKAAAKKTAK